MYREVTMMKSGKSFDSAARACRSSGSPPSSGSIPRPSAGLTAAATAGVRVTATISDEEVRHVR
jgi:hypothetical protein